MIKLKLLIENENVSDIVKSVNERYPLAGREVDGRTVLSNIDNWSSINASLYQYDILEGVREVPMSDFHLTGKTYSVEGNQRIQALAREIQETKTISPLIVVVDSKGPYILEGSHRADALKLLGAKSFPALVVVDLE